MSTNLRPAPMERYTVSTNTATLSTAVTVAAVSEEAARAIAFSHFRRQVPGYNDLRATISRVFNPTGDDLDEAHAWAIANDDTLAHTYMPVMD